MDKNAVKDAVQFLVDTDRYAELKKNLKVALANWKTKPMVFVGELAILNALLDVGILSGPAFQNVFDIIERTRRGSPTTGKTDYMRGHMAARRARERKAVQLAEIINGRKMKPDEKEAYAMAVHTGWMVKRGEYMAEREPLEWSERNAVIGDYWRAVDAELDRDLEEAQRVLSHAPV